MPPGFNQGQQRVRGTISSLISALKACSSSKDLIKGRIVHGEAVQLGADSNLFVANTLVSMYAKCGSMEEARKVFDRILFRDVVSWTALMLGYAENGEEDLALSLLPRMRDEGCSPNARTFVAAAKACTSIAAKEDGKQVDGRLVKMESLEKGLTIHSEAADAGFCSDLYLASTLINMYAKCGNMVSARRVFDDLWQRDIVLWNALILGYVENGEPEVALDLSARMSSECGKDGRTFLAELRACTTLAVKEDGEEINGKLVKLKSLERGMAVHAQVVNGRWESDIFVASALIDLYAKCGSMVDAQQVFDKMKHHDAVCWTALILGYAENGEDVMALELFSQMQQRNQCQPDTLTFIAALTACSNLAAKEEGKQIEGRFVKVKSLEQGMAIHSQASRYKFDSQILVASSLVNMYAKCYSMVDARKVFDTMKYHTVVSWNALMMGYAESSEPELALFLLERMETEGCLPNALTLVAALKACGNMGVLKLGKAVHAEVLRYGFENVGVVANSLVDLYGKLGRMMDAQMVFDSVAKKDSITWTGLIAGYSRQGDTESVLKLFHKMVEDEGFQADAITFVSLLTACCNAGLIDKGRRYLEAMSTKYGIKTALTLPDLRKK